MTQEMLSERSGLSVGAINRIEGGSRTPTLTSLEELAAALGVSVSDLTASQGPPRAARVSRETAGLVAMLESEPAWVRRVVVRTLKALVRALRDQGFPEPSG